MSLCDRCPGGQECRFDYMGKACKEYRASETSGVFLTRGDMIRAASDEQLADMFTALLSAQRKLILSGLQKAGVAEDICVVEMPLLSKKAHLEWLRERAEEV